MMEEQPGRNISQECKICAIAFIEDMEYWVESLAHLLYIRDQNFVHKISKKSTKKEMHEWKCSLYISI